MSKPIARRNKKRASFGVGFQPNDAPAIKPVRRGKGKWLMLPRSVKISRSTIAAAIRADRGA
jgi:hypothetical protein